MDAEIVRRLDRQDRILGAILAALAPLEEETEGSAFDDLVEALSDLTAAVGDVTQSVRALRSDACAHSHQAGEPSFAAD